ncbi:ATP-binding protein [Geomesophilobacter sediminis]|uniref:histidine kinase n=1 Tax=Geomesophilobacter sediminis TaxID=2798584 RepID=A0A8J7JAB0_9BACT|nr:ATP-binding protein [Geomesophilobacter sediminis]MBJ6723786.1 response regulator [Geomesophilobacter sediminis]
MPFRFIRESRFSLAFRLIAGIFVINVFAWAVAGMALVQSRLDREDRARVAAQNLAQLLDRDLSGLFERIDVSLQSVVDECGREQRKDGVPIPGELNPFLARVRSRLPEVEGLRVVDKSGAIRYGNALPRGNVNIADRDYFRHLRENPGAEMIFARPLIGRVSQKWTLNLARRIDAPDGTFYGIVLATIPLTNFVSRFSTLDVGPHGGISLRDREMAIIARYPELSGIGSAVGNRVLSPEFRSRFRAGLRSATFYTRFSWEGEEKVVSYHRIGDYPLYIAVGVANRDFLASWWNIVRLTALLVLTFTLVTVVLARLVLVKWAQEGEARDQLRAAKEELELRVVQRTAELSRANHLLKVELKERAKTVAELRRAEELQQLSERRFRDMLESINLAAVTLDQHGRITYCNDFFLRLVGWERAEVLHGNWFEKFVPQDSAPLRRAEFEQRFLERDLPLHLEYPIVTRDGSRRVIEWSLTLLRGADDVVTGVAGIGIDRTDQKSLEAQLRQSQKMEAVGQLAGGVAHDFNNILTVILGYCALLEMSAGGDGTHRHEIRQIADAAERAAALTRSLLAFSRKEAMHPELHDLNGVVDKVKGLLSRVIGEDVSLQVELSALPLVGKVDRAMIEQVLMNLATNARDAMPRGGLLGISTELVDLDEEYVQTHGCGTPGPHALICVSDTGVGMDADTRNRVFEPFFTTKEVGKGTGLGMSIVYGIVKQHRGNIHLYSEPGQGTTYRVFLPLDPAVAAGVVPAVPVPERGGSETILVVEDEAPVQGIVEKVLRRSGYEVIVASDGKEGIELFAGNRDRIRLVLMDIIMPGMNGKEAWERIKELKPQARVLFTSGYTADVIQSRGELADGAEIIMKPVHPQALLRRIREILDAPAARG